MKNKEEKKNNRPQESALRMFQLYWLTMLLCLCIGTAAVGIRIAANSTHALSFGEEQTRVVMRRRENALTLHGGGQEYRWNPAIPPALDAALRFSPPPWSALYWGAQCVAELLE